MHAVCVRLLPPLAFVAFVTVRLPTTHAIVTTSASEDIADIHDRMPVALKPAEIARWLDPACGQDELTALMEPGVEGRFRLREVSARVNSVRNDDKACLDPVETQSSLFD